MENNFHKDYKDKRRKFDIDRLTHEQLLLRIHNLRRNFKSIQNPTGKVNVKIYLHELQSRL